MLTYADVCWSGSLPLGTLLSHTHTQPPQTHTRLYPRRLLHPPSHPPTLPPQTHTVEERGRSPPQQLLLLRERA